MFNHISPPDSIKQDAITQCVERLNIPNNSEQAIKALKLFKKTLDEDGKIILTGLGKSGKIAQKIASTLSSTGSYAIFLHPTEALHGDLGLAHQNDVLFALSNTGNTPELLELIAVLKSRGLTTVCLGGNPNSQLAHKADLWIDAFVDKEACTHQLAPTASTTLALALGDAVAITLMKMRGIEPSEFAKNHPGGALGKRLSCTVEALMHKGDEIPLVLPNASFDEIIIVATQKKLGTVLIVENQKLLGIITDGDLRRVLKLHREKLFQMTASELMHTNPITAQPQMLAKDALDLMEKRTSKISALPVINTEQKLVGILHLHDVVKNI
ncbi:MAG: KpsF/GutQ family sugar-phosphate isomerase [Deltaproteobacteria bacterium]|nr:KpsF/GutQ family sugar-phosphate isomerase [Deltaproteobacteria bacterium]